MQKLSSGLTTLIFVIAFMVVAINPQRGGSHANAGSDDPVPMTVRGAVWDSICAKAGSHGKTMADLHVTDVKQCTLACVATGAEFVLFDSDAKIIYRLDAQDKAKQYAGQTVTVKGNYDRATGMLHVDSIDAVT